MEVRVGPSVIVAHLDDEILVSDTDASLSGDAQEGYFIADTRLVSGYRLKLGRAAPVLLNSSQIGPSSARFELTNPELLDDNGFDVPEHSLHLRLDRVLGRGVHEDYELVNYAGHPVNLIVEVSVESDFADIFDVKDGRLQRRGIVRSTWDDQSAVLSNR
ncbi:MAG: glycogen debranching N-terminal domain-containing protein, partial [Acidimicrobiales bacterium]